MERIRLACRLCDRDDFDGVAEVPGNWFDVEEVQSHEASLQTVRPDHSEVVPTVVETGGFSWIEFHAVCFRSSSG